ncbi:MAG: tRNA preQ1(34) S-adenosylmethionine ribosyltransferase-isomerase QueA [Syntrophorhabdaceae bacterium]|nr:tRNA preQ1(34) S-adenosylmethionine ribosyltransferase-isomerase QueA [Syntrophorhabdaceae bacterium]
MRIEEFDYILPKKMIAQYPLEDRASSRLFVYERSHRRITHLFFRDIIKFFKRGDVLVLNESKVFPARLKGKKKTGGAVDILLLKKIGDRKWSCLIKGMRSKVDALDLLIGDIKARIMREKDGFYIEFFCQGDEYDTIRKYGEMPLPPYIKRKEGDVQDFERYQTVYAKTEGSIAAPTAGFHFTDSLLEEIEGIGVNIAKITLHIGKGTFSLIREENIEHHEMESEYFTTTPDVIDLIKRAKAEGKRVVACGTSTVRTVETIFSKNGTAEYEGYTDLFIFPGYRFKVVDALITNFHLPRSTPLLLVSAFMGKENLMLCYGEAIEKGYRFYSYGDAMLII